MAIIHVSPRPMWSRRFVLPEPTACSSVCLRRIRKGFWRLIETQSACLSSWGSEAVLISSPKSPGALPFGCNGLGWSGSIASCKSRAGCGNGTSRQIWLLPRLSPRRRSGAYSTTQQYESGWLVTYNRYPDWELATDPCNKTYWIKAPSDKPNAIEPSHRCPSSQPRQPVSDEALHSLPKAG